MRAYAVTTKSRLATLPELPTADEAGLPGFEVSTWYGLYAPKGTPKPVLDRLLGSRQAALNDPSVVQRFGELSMQPVPAGKEVLVINNRGARQIDVEPWPTVPPGSIGPPNGGVEEGL